ncbi:MAG: hypothetical protein KAW12_13420 [Candidatus Aminicenantes bacterium]|nr:hypothetical protein [Candidatus Aminicenantes bacterium]
MIKYKVRENWPLFEYEDGMKVKVAYLGDDENLRLVRQSNDVDFDKKSHQRTDKLNPIKLRKKIIKKVLMGWEIRRKHLKLMLEPIIEIQLDEGQTWEDSIPFNDETLGIVVEHHNWQFGEWLVGQAKDVAEYEKGKKKDELANLQPGSPGVKNTKASPGSDKKS